MIAYTVTPAYINFEEKTKGTLEVGKLTDFVILDENTLEIPANKIREIEVDYTIVGGRVMFKR